MASALRAIHRLALAATALALVVVVLGAWVRLSDAGLGCPDWPGCYGHLGVPDAAEEVAAANAAYPERPVEAAKAWKEMIHRYLASALGVLVLLIALLCWRARAAGGPWRHALALLALVVFQGLLGMWTVTLLVKPVIVTAHLFGGLTSLSLLFLLALRTGSPRPPAAPTRALSLGAWAALAVLLGQVFLGGWTSTNYAALSCPELPTCQGQWWPQTDFDEAFTLWRGLGVDYEFGVLENDARVAIHLSHRLGALLTLAVLLTLAWRLRAADSHSGRWGTALAALVLIQFALGLSNVLFGLPLWVATAHNGGAAACLLVLVGALHRLRPAS